MNTAAVTIMGLEAMRGGRNGQATICNLTHDILGTVRMVERTFGLGALPGERNEVMPAARDIFRPQY